jgi:hypothetical protein
MFCNGGRLQATQQVSHQKHLPDSEAEKGVIEQAVHGL